MSRLGAVSLLVRDYDEAIAFYVGTLGFDLTSDLGWASLKYLAGYQQYDYNTSTDSDGSPRTAARTR